MSSLMLGVMKKLLVDTVLVYELVCVDSLCLCVQV